jgi:hypothetical protein
MRFFVNVNDVFFSKGSKGSVVRTKEVKARLSFVKQDFTVPCYFELNEIVSFDPNGEAVVRVPDHT